METIRILLADDHLLIRVGIRALLETLPGYCVVAECADGHETIEAIRRLSPDVVLLDIAMPGPSGIEVAQIIRQHDATTRILVLSSIDRPQVVEQAMQAGADGYLLKDFILSELQQALSMVMSGQCFMSPRIQGLHPGLSSATEHAQGAVLTARQTEILRLVASGRTTKEIARDLGISPKTVEFHRGRLMERTGTHDVTGLTRFALQSGVLN